MSSTWLYVINLFPPMQEKFIKSVLYIIYVGTRFAAQTQDI